jgi:septal ring factor EnvC (AmiA/AmiB activator)
MKKLTMLLPVLTAMFFVGCDSDRHPSYEELKSENEQLEAQLASANEEVQQAKSDLEDLKSEIDSGACDEDAARNKADDIDNTLDQAEDDTQ